MKALLYVLAGILGLLGLVFLAAAGQGNAIVRVIIGAILLGAAGAIVALSRLKPTQTTHVYQQKIDLSGDVAVQDLKCKSCGGSLSEKSVTVSAGAVFVSCEYCGAQYQLEEAPKW